MSEVRIIAEPRTEFGKGAARRVRRANKVPAVVYGHGEAPRHVQLPGHELMLALKTPNVLLELDLGGERQLALPKDVQRDPVKGFLEHVDLVVVNRGEKVTVEIPVHVTGEVSGDLTLVVDHNTLTVEASADSIPESVDVAVEGLEVGAQVHASDIELPQGVTLGIEGDTLMASVTAAPTAEQVDADLAQSEADLGIVHEAPAAEAAAEAQAAELGTATQADDES